MPEPSREHVERALRRAALPYDPDDRQNRAMALTVIVRTTPWEPGPDGIVPQIIDALQTHADEVADSAVDRLIDALLTSTDPAVLEAMQDSLVRAGRLTEQRTEWGVMHHDGSVSSRFNGRTAKGRCYSEAGHLSFIHAPDNIRPASRRVFVTEWTEAPDA